MSALKIIFLLNVLLIHNELTNAEKLSVKSICGLRPLANLNKIVNGTVATPGDWSWNVILFQIRNQHF